MSERPVDLKTVRALVARLDVIAPIHPERVNASNTDVEIEAWEKELEEMERRDEEEKNRQTEKD